MKQLDFILPAALELENDFLTDHNRSELSINNNRIVNDIRTQFGDLRRYYRADKKSFSVSWNMLPQSSAETVDRNLGAEEMIEKFKNLTGVCTLKVYYDFGEEEEYRVLITDFEATLLKRWNPYRFYNVSLEMDEV